MGSTVGRVWVEVKVAVRVAVVTEGGGDGGGGKGGGGDGGGGEGGGGDGGARAGRVWGALASDV